MIALLNTQLLKKDYPVILDMLFPYGFSPPTKWIDDVIQLLIFMADSRWGHNELDEPTFTNPDMYSAVRSRVASIPDAYCNKYWNKKFTKSYGC